MKLNIVTTENQTNGSVDVPAIFKEAVRGDLIKRAFNAAQSAQRQAYGPDERAGRKATANVSKKRRDYKGCYGKGIARSPRKVMWRRGVHFNWTGANAPNTVGGPRAFGPQLDKVWTQKLNQKERRKAIRSALAATLDKEQVKARGHEVPESYPFVLANDFETLKTTKDVRSALEKIALDKELARTEVPVKGKGRAKTRGRKKKTRMGPLLVVAKECPLSRAARNLPGVDVTTAKKLGVQKLAPGAHAARLTLFTQDALELIAKEGLFQ